MTKTSVVGEILPKIILGFLFLVLFILIFAITKTIKRVQPQDSRTVEMLRRSVKAHEVGVYNGYYIR